MTDTPTIAPEEPATATNVDDFFAVDETLPSGKLLDSLKGFVEDNMKPSLVTVVDPLSGTVALAAAVNGELKPIPASIFDDYLPAPRFRRGIANMTSLDSFIEHVNRFRSDATVVFADDSRTSPKLTAVLNYHAAGAEAAPSHGRHRTTFSFPMSDEWKAWHGISGKSLSVREFAEFIEDRIVDVELPIERELTEDQAKLVDKLGGTERIGTPTALFDLSRGLHVNENNAVAQAVNLSTGEGEITFVEKHEDTTTVDGRPILVPTTFVLAIPVFKNGAYYQVLARLRYSTRPSLTFKVELWRTDKIFDHAFTEACQKVASETGQPLLLGAPEA